MKQWLTLVGALMLLVASGVEAPAQQTGTARGKVVDQDGAPVAGATVELEFLGSGASRKYRTETNEKGEYTQMVVYGRFRITATKDGYRGTYLERRIESGPPTLIPTLELSNLEAEAQAAMAPILEQFEKASALVDAGKLDEAIAAYRELEVEHPNIPELYFNMGTLHGRLEQWPEAEAAFQKVLELEPDNSQAKVLLAEIHKNMGRGDEALATMEKLIEESPDDPELRYNLGVFYLNAQRYEEAYGAFDEAKKLAPDNVNVHYLLGTISLNLGKLDQAAAHLQDYLDRAPEDGQYRATATALLSNIKPSGNEGQ